MDMLLKTYEQELQLPRYCSWTRKSCWQENWTVSKRNALQGGAQFRM